MILIADSGSTKTDWRLIDDRKKIHQFTSQGINPYFQTSDQISEILRYELLSHITPVFENPISEIFFYGAGCRAEDKQLIVRKALEANFIDTSIEIETDMLGAARSLCGNGPGIAAILGTGMNTCFYDGRSIIENRTSLGYILGDEGSGAYIGKKFIADYLNKEMPDALSKVFSERFKLIADDIIDSVYRKPMPNRFLATFSKFVYQNLKEQYCIDLVKNSFEDFFDKYICKYYQYKNVKFSCTGSVAFYYSNILRSVAESRGVNIDKIVETPIAGLTLYHLGED